MQKKESVNLKTYGIPLGKQTWFMGVSENREKKVKKRIFKEIMSENFPNLGKYIGIQIHETQEISSEIKK